METPQAIQECAQMLALAAAAVERLTGNQKARPSSPRMAELLQEVSQIAERLEQLSALMIEQSCNAEGADPNKVRARLSHVH